MRLHKIMYGHRIRYWVGGSALFILSDVSGSIFSGPYIDIDGGGMEISILASFHSEDYFWARLVIWILWDDRPLFRQI